MERRVRSRARDPTAPRREWHRLATTGATGARAQPVMLRRMTSERRAEIFFWAAIAIGVVFIVVGGPLARRLELVHMNDFSGVWSGARAIVLGVDPWDPTKYYGFAVDAGTKTPDALVYDYMPWVAFAVAPLAMVPLAGVVVIIAWLAAPPDWFPAWLDDIPPRRTIRSAVLPSALNQLIGPSGRYVAYALIAVGAVVAARFRPGSDASLAAWLSLSNAGAIYSWSYDQVLLFVPAVITAGILVRRSERLGRRFALAAAGTLLIVSPVFYGIAVLRHDETFSVLVPLGFFVAIVLLLWREPAGESAAVARVEPALA